MLLKGWLKIPKGGKLKKGWIDKYCIVKDYKLWMFDRENEIDSVQGTLIADFRQVFFIKSTKKRLTPTAGGSF